MPEKILVIDDDVDSLKLIGLMLERRGYQVLTAQGGDQGLAQAETESPDLILLDIMMPYTDGYEVCRRLRSNPRLAHIPVIMFTAKTRVDDKVAGFEAGADDYLTKPTHPAELASRIKALMSRPAPEIPAARQPAEGKVIGILGVKGGSGVTTLAVNLSVASTDAGRSLILADLHSGAGTVGLHLGHPRGAGLSHLLQARLTELGSEQVRHELVDYSPGMRLLLAPYQPTGAAAPLSAAHVGRIVGILPKMADLVVLDLGSRLGDGSLQALRLADQIIICLAPQRIPLTMAQTLLPHLRKNGIRHDRVGIVLVSTVPSSATIDVQEIEEQLQLPVLGSIAPDPQLALEAIERTRPMVKLQPQSPTAGQFRELAQRIIAGVEPRATPAG